MINSPCLDSIGGKVLSYDGQKVFNAGNRRNRRGGFNNQNGRNGGRKNQSGQDNGKSDGRGGKSKNNNNRSNNSKVGFHPYLFSNLLRLLLGEFIQWERL